MSPDTTTPDPMELTPENLWLSVYRDRVRGGVGYEFIVATPGEEGRAAAHRDRSTYLALSLTELETIHHTLATATPLRAPGALNWLPVGMGRQVVWSYKDGTPVAQLVLARSAQAAADLVESEGSRVATTTDLAQMEAVIAEMKDVLAHKRYDKILVDIRPQEGGFGNNWLEKKKDPVLDRICQLTDALTEADLRGEKDPVAAQELVDIYTHDGQPMPPLPDVIAYLDHHLAP